MRIPFALSVKYTVEPPLTAMSLQWQRAPKLVSIGEKTSRQRPVTDD